MISSSAHTNQPVKKLQVFDSSYFDLIRMYAMYCIYVWIYMSMYNMFFSLYLSTLIAKASGSGIIERSFGFIVLAVVGIISIDCNSSCSRRGTKYNLS